MRDFTSIDRQSMQDPLFATWYAHAARHDSTWDGRFVFGSQKSENFCRPGCLSPIPRPSRIIFYRTSAAAHAAGLHPCPRCRPDLTPTSRLVFAGDSLGERAIRLIADGGIDRDGVVGVARTLRTTPRHLQRAVRRVVDCSPLEYARAERAHTARLLLVMTTLPMADVSIAAGFATVRQFNATIQEMYGMTPGRLRFGVRQASPGDREAGPLTLRCVLPTPRPVSAEVFELLSGMAIPEIESGTDHWFARTVRLPHGSGHVRVDRERAGRLLAKFTVGDPRDLVPLRNRTVALFADPSRLASGAMDTGEVLVRSVVSRDRPIAAARTILGALGATLGEVSPWGPVFPTAAAIAEQAHLVLRGPRQRIDEIARAARAIASGDVAVDAGWSPGALIERHPDLFGP